LPKYCPNCGVKLVISDVKFCSECGYALQVSIILEEATIEEKVPREEEEELTTSIYELGNRLEEVVEKIFQSRGFETERRRRLEGKSGTKSEIDIIAKKSGKTIAVECKNYSDPVSIDKVRDFSQKLQDLDLRWNGIFVSFSGFTSEASQFAQHNKIETWERDEISEKWLTLSVGRAESRKGQSLTLEYALPLNIDFNHATFIDLQNKDKIQVSNTELIYHPYFLIEYVLKDQFKDPTKKLHRFEDRDTLFIDALDGSIINPMPSKGVGVLEKTIKLVTSKRVRAENQRNKKLLQELRSYDQRRKYTLNIENDYQVNTPKHIITPGQAERMGYDFIIEKNTQIITYYPKTKGDYILPEIKAIKYIPKRTDIRINLRDIVVVPRWSVDFDSFGTSYAKEILACSGTILEDTLSFCPKHYKLAALTITSKKTVAVCEICGQSLCEEHVKRCPTCGKWLCEEHGVECSSCQTRFCKEHITQTCPFCNSAICNLCIITCPVCNTQYGKDHAMTCDKCGTLVCPNCVITTGFIRKTKTCKKCSFT